MAVSCSEVMYGAYYPYLYGRGAARSFHHAPHFQYDRFNMGSGGGVGEAYGGAGGAALSTGSSSGAQSPVSPPHAHHHPHHPAAHPAAALPPSHHAPRLRAKEEDLSAHGRTSADGGGGSSESEGECGGGVGAAAAGSRARAQYVSANCVVFTHYSGDVATVVDEHFTRALSGDKPKESVPMVSRNLPASFFNAAATAGVPSCGMELYEYDPWAAHAHATHYAHAHGGYAPRHEYHGMAGYQQLLLGRGMPQYKPVEWSQPHHLEPAPYSYPSVPGLEAQVQDSSKDLYWF